MASKKRPELPPDYQQQGTPFLEARRFHIDGVPHELPYIEAFYGPFSAVRECPIEACSAALETAMGNPVVYWIGCAFEGQTGGLFA